MLLTTYPESINVKNGFGYTPLAEARALENPKMEPIIQVLEKFKVEQDKIKVDSGENAVLEHKLDQLSKRVVVLEKLLANVMEIGSDIKASVKKAKDPYILIDKMADRLANLDMPVDDSLSGAGSKANQKRGVFGRKTNAGRSPRVKK